jgi:uncharacterized membrane protein YsdA (DUF1294 family)
MIVRAGSRRSPHVVFTALGAAIAVMVAVVVAVAVAYLTWPSGAVVAGAGRLAPWLLALLAGVNAATLLLYVHDKLAARRAGAPRVPEAVLHLFELCGGTPAAWLCQRWLRHKSAKQPYRRVFRAIVIAQAIAAVVVLIVLYRLYRAR